MLKDSVPVSCPFKELGFCIKSCANYEYNLDMAEQVAKKTNSSLRSVVAKVVFDSRTHFLVPVFKNFYYKTSSKCENNIKH